MRFWFRFSSRLTALSIALIILSPIFAVSQDPAALSAPPYQPPRSHNYDVQHYRIAVSFDWAKKSVTGETTITFRPDTNDLRDIDIDAGNMTINSVKLASGQPLKFQYEKNEHLLVTLDHIYSRDKDVSIVIGYNAIPKKGLTFITPSESEPNRPYQIWSQGESEANHYWFPCYDYPNDKATTELIATVDDKFRVISNGALTQVLSNGGKKTKTWHWKMDQPYSTYLVSVIVGQFAEIRDQYKNIPVMSYVYSDEVQNARLSFANLTKMVAFFSQITGHEYPYAKYAQTTVRDFNGGMENITATTLSDTSVHDRRAHLDVSSDSLTSHELAHSWFGDMITCRDWGNLWLNEGFASFFGALWTEHDLGRDEYLYEMLQNQQQYFITWNLGNHRPIVVNRYSDPEMLFDAHNYQRAAAVIGMLRFVLGDERFWKAIRHYVDKYKWKNVETNDLITAIEEATGQNLRWFFDEWVFKMGHPEFEVTTSYDEQSKLLKLTVKQTQKPDEKRPWFSSPDFFVMPVDIGITTDAGEKVERILINKREMEFSLAVPSKPLFVNFDRGNYLIKQVKQTATDDELANQLLRDSDVTGRLRAARELKLRRTAVAGRALKASLKDPFWGVRFESVQALSPFINDSTGLAEFALLEAVKDTDSRVRRVAVQGLGLSRGPNMSDLFTGIIHNDQSYYVVAEAAAALGHTGSPTAYNLLVDLANQSSWQGIITGGALRGLAALKDPRSVQIAIKYSGAQYRPPIRFSAFQLLGDVGKGNPEAITTLCSALKDPEFDQSLAMAAFALTKIGDAKVIPVLEEFSRRPDLPPTIRQFVVQAISRLAGQTKEGEKKP